jgi:hypothetical protein
VSDLGNGFFLLAACCHSFGIFCKNTMDMMLWNDDEELEAIITVMESDSDDDDSDIVAGVIIRNPPVVRGSRSRPRKAPNIDRQRMFYSRLLYKDFFGESQTYNTTYPRGFSSFQLGFSTKL